MAFRRNPPASQESAAINKGMSSFCSVYTGSGTTWPVRQFPSSSFPRGSAARLRDAARAWAFFEQVEAYDAAVRVKYAAAGGFVPSDRPVVTQAPWYTFKSEGERVVYKRGQSLHRELCPDINWTSQRNMGIPTIPITDVYPNACSDVPGDGGRSMNPVILGERSHPSPAMSGRSGSLYGIPLFGQISSTATSSRRDSIDHV